MQFTRAPFLVVLAAALTTNVTAQERSKSSITFDGGLVTVDYTTTKIGSRSPVDIPVGTVWRMSKDAAATLTTAVPLASRTATLAPGSYRLSARRVSESKWELVIFEGGFIFQDDMAHQTSSLRLDAESTAVENLTIQMKKSRTAARLKLSWGKHSLNTRFEVLPSKTFDATIGGKPAEFTFFGISVGRSQSKLTSGKPLVIGMARRTNGGLEFTMTAQQKGNAVDLVFTNVTLDKVRARIKASKADIARLEKLLPDRKGEQATELRKRIDNMKRVGDHNEILERQTAAFARETRIAGTISDTRQASRTLEAAAKKDDAGIEFTITFGAKVATFQLTDGALNRK